MRDIEGILVNENFTLKDVLEILDSTAKQICLVVDDQKRLIGTINDGDIRRALLKNVPLTSPIDNVYFKTPTTANINDSRASMIELCKARKVHQLPLIDDAGVVVGLEVLDELAGAQKRKNKVILMVGGLGTRLRPLTDTVPKPMLPVGGKPMLQIIVEQLVGYGFSDLIMCVGYKAELIQEFFGDGKAFGANIQYVLEKERMGTAGALSLLSAAQQPAEAFVVMNGDLQENLFTPLVPESYAVDDQR